LDNCTLLSNTLNECAAAVGVTESSGGLL
jgi:hypothetical protein